MRTASQPHSRSLQHVLVLYISFRMSANLKAPKLVKFINFSAIIAGTSVFANGQAAANAPERGGISFITIILLLIVAAGIGFLIYRKFFDNSDAGVQKGLPPRRTPQPAKRPAVAAAKSDVRPPRNIDRPFESGRPKRTPDLAAVINEHGEASPAESLLKKKLQNRQYLNLPINSFEKVKASREFLPLPLSDDESLLAAIEQMQEEFEADEDLRGLSLRILAAFRTRNSVEVLAQTAMYDLSSTLRSRAIGILTEIDHETVFEPILLACADPTREVRAAAARGIFRLSFNRADAWTRIAETGDEFRMRGAVRAAIEGNLVRNSLDRLVHEDMNVAYEAFALTALIVRSGELEPIFEALGGNIDATVKRAILHVLNVAGDERVAAPISELLSKQLLSADLAAAAGEIMRRHESVVLEAF